MSLIMAALMANVCCKWPVGMPFLHDRKSHDEPVVATSARNHIVISPGAALEFDT